MRLFYSDDPVVETVEDEVVPTLDTSDVMEEEAVGVPIWTYVFVAVSAAVVGAAVARLGKKKQ